MQFQSKLLSFLIGTLLALPLGARAQTGPDLFALWNVAETDPAQAAQDIDAALAQIQAAPDPDPRTLFDLYRLRADVARQTGDLLTRAGILAELAQFATRVESLEENPVALWSEAANAAEQAGDLRLAQQVLREKLKAQIDRNQLGTDLAQTYDDLARVAQALGDSDAAARNMAAAETARNPVAAVGNDGTRGNDEGFRPVDVYYATDRARTGDSSPTLFYGGGRGSELELGVATVTIPNVHAPGMLEAPSVWKLEFAPNPAKHVVLQSVTPMPRDGFFGKLQGEFADGQKTDAFVFIHGFNVKFDQAARRAAQMAYDMDFPGVPILYSWPSRGMTVAYVADTAVVRLSGRRLADFLDDLVDNSGATTIHIVAHSMGNRALTDALEILALKRDVTAQSDPLFGQVLFAAPDVDAGLFARMIQTIRPIAKRLTLYASEKDWALVSSRKLHGNAPRAGQGGEDTLADNNVDSIDMSELGEDMLAHSYFADDSSALADMVTLFWQNTEPAKRCGLREHRPISDGPVVWQYESGKCATRNLIDAVAHMQNAHVSSLSEALRVLSNTAQDPSLLLQLEPVIKRILEP